MPEEVPTPKHETSDVSATAAAWFGFGLAVSVAIIGVIIWKMEAPLDPTGPALPHSPNIATSQFQAPQPMLQSDPAAELQVLRAEEDKALKSYAWLDRKAGIIRIPLERAKALILQRGLPTTGTTMPLPGPPIPPATQVPVPIQGGTP